MEDLLPKKEGMADRRAELEKKRQKLALLREEKARRKREKETQQEEDLANIKSKYEKDARIDTDKLLASLNVTTSIASLPSDSGISNSSLSKSVTPQPSPVKPKKVNLSVVQVHQASVAPQEKVVYNRQTQTLRPRNDSSTEKDALSVDYYEWEDEFQVLTYDDSSISEDGESLSLPSIDGVMQQFPKHGKATVLPNIGIVKPTIAPGDENNNLGDKRHGEAKKKVADLSEEEKLLTMRSQNFRQFLDRSSRIMERALSEEIDIFVDYTGSKEESESDDRRGMSLSLNRCFFDENWSKNRTVTSFDWSTQFPELLCASYNQNEDAPHLPDGVCLIWNMKFKKKTPEYVFHCQSPITAACFAKYHPNLVIGGTYSGQVVLWDNRSNKRTPVQRSPLSAIAHTHPVYSISMVGSENAHNLVTVSTDGKCCTWSVDMLSGPQDTIELNQQKQSRTVAVTCMAFPNDEFNNFVVGSEDGIVYSACRHGSKSGIVDAFESHQGPITAISTHKSRGSTEYPDLFLTSSFDWTIKLWSLKKTQPLYSFEHNSDYVFDVSWSPVHPALFACVDSLGNLDLWNLNCDSELPTVSMQVDGSPALNRVSWTPSGQHVSVGDNAGKIWLYDVGEQLAHPKADEWIRFSETLEEFQNNQSYNTGDAMSPQDSASSFPLSAYMASTPLR